jgi:hypothetical protein
MLACACNAKQKELEKAREQHAAGQLDEALTTLELVVHAEPSTPEAEQSRALATEWLLAAGASGDAVSRRVRLEQALKWSPRNGTAQARLCVLLVEAKDFAGAKSCVNEKLADKSDVPQELVQRVNAALAANSAAETDAERQRWLASSSSHHWKALVEKYPDSKEAAAAKQKLRLRESVCADLTAFSQPLRTEIERQKRLAALIAERGAAGSTQSERIAGFDELVRDAAKKAREFSDLKADLDGHPARPGEEASKRGLGQAAQLLADLAGALEQDLERHPLENLDSYDAKALGAIKRWAAAAERTTARAAKELGAAEKACQSSP